MQSRWAGGETMPLIDSLKNSRREQQTARLEVWTKFENTMMYIPPEERKPEPEPKRTVYTVKRGDKVKEGSFRVKNVADGEITVEFEMEHIGSAYGEDGYAVRNYEVGTVFTFKKGEELSLSLYGLMDADSRVYIKYLD